MNVLVVDLGSRMNSTGGQARVAAELFRGLGRRFSTYYLGYETEYLKPGQNTLMLERSLGAGLKKSRLSESALMRLGYNLIVVRNLLGIDKRELVRKVGEIKPDVVIANSIGDLALLKYLKRHGMEFRSVYIDHGSAAGTVKGYFSKEGVPLTVGSGVTASSTEGALKQFFGFFDMTVALSKRQLSDIGRFTERAVYIPNGIKPAPKRNARLEAGVRGRCGIEKGKFVVLYLGRLFERQKNVSVLINSFKRLEHEDMRLLIVGEGPSMQDYRELAGTDRRIVFAGRLEDSLIPYVYDVSDVYVLPSNWEGFSLTLLEAASHSLPIIISKSIDSEEYRVGGKGLATFDNSNPDGLKGELELVRHDKATRDRMAAVSRALAKKYSEQKMLDSYAKLMLDLTGK